jgi:hypothetical protein
MPIPAFGNTEYDEVRAAIDLRVTADTLPNTVIALPAFEGEARAYIGGLVKDATITNYADRVKTAAVLYTAALLLPSLPDVTREQIPGGMMWFGPKDLLKLSALRKEEALIVVGALQDLEAAGVEPGPATDLPNMFTAAGPACDNGLTGWPRFWPAE